MVNWNHIGPLGVAEAGDRGHRGTCRSHSGQTEGAAEMLKGGLTAPLIFGAEQMWYPSFSVTRTYIRKWHGEKRDRVTDQVTHPFELGFERGVGQIPKEQFKTCPT